MRPIFRAFMPVFALTLAIAVPDAALAQASSSGRPAGPPALVEGAAGYLGFTDESLIDHLALTGSGRLYVTRRIAVGPEVGYFNGPGPDRDWRIAGTASVDLVAPGARGPRRVTPYVLGGFGWMTSTLPTGAGLYTSSEGAVTAGGGVRILTAGGWYVAPELRIGWEPHVHYSVSIGRRLGRGR